MTNARSISRPTAGQQLADELLRYFKVGTRTRRHRRHPWGHTQDLHNEMLQAIREAATLPGCHTDRTESALRPGFGAYLAYTKHVTGCRIDPALRHRITTLSPYRFAALLGQMVDANVTNTGEGEMFFAAMARAGR